MTVEGEVTLRTTGGVNQGGRKLHRLSIDQSNGLFQLDVCSAGPWIEISPSNRYTWMSGPKFPKLEECTHFHYDAVSLAPHIAVSLGIETQHKPSTKQCYTIQVRSGAELWSVTRRYDDIVCFDEQLHRCVFDRRYSQLEALPATEAEDCVEALKQYFERFTFLVQGTSHIKCGNILNWLEMDNKSQHFLWHLNSGINVPGIAVATVTHNYLKREQDELELRVGDLVSIIDMPHPSESPWWRGKHSNRVGFFPSTCVEVIPGSQNRKPPNNRALSATHPTVTTTQSADSGAEGARKKRNLKGRLAVLFASRPERDSLRQKGILRGRVFGAHLSELLHDSNRKVPLIVEVCCRTVERHGVVEGVYRKSGINSNIQKLRQEFDSERPPDAITEERYMNDIHCVASLCKMYFRELPDPLLTYQLYDSFAEAVSLETQEQRLEATRRVVRQLPPFHYSTLSFLSQHLNVIARASSQHGMHSRNLALVWAPNLLKPVESESDASAFTAIKIQSVVLQFLIDHAAAVFRDETEEDETASSIRRSQSSQMNCNSPFLDNASQTSSVQIINAAGMSAHRRAANRIILTTGGDEGQAELTREEEGEEEEEEEVVSDVIRNRATSDVTNNSTAKYQYLMKIPLMELGEAQRAHSVKEDISEQARPPGFFRRRHKKNKRHSSHEHGSPSHWTKSFFGLSSKLRLPSGRSGTVRPVISGPCGFVADPYSTVIGGNQPVQQSPAAAATCTLAEGSTSCVSSTGSSAFNNVLVLGNQIGIEESFDKSEFVAEWCSDAIRQFLSGKSITQIQNNTVTDRSSATSTTTDDPGSKERLDSVLHSRSKERLDNILRCKSLPNKRKHTNEIHSPFRGSITHSLVEADCSPSSHERQLKIPRRPLSCVSCPENASPSSRPESILTNKFRCSLNIDHRTSNSIIV